MRAYLACVVASILVVGSSRAAPTPPRVLLVEPGRIELTSARDRVQFVVRLREASGRLSDVTHAVSYRVASPTRVEVSPTGEVRPRSVGAGRVEIRHGPHKVSVPVRVTSLDSPKVDFRREVAPLLTRAGCNASNCHGWEKTPSKLRLSTLGFDFERDFETLTRGNQGRWLGRFRPEKSLVLSVPKANPNRCGRKLRERKLSLTLLRQWIEEGTPWATERGELAGIEVYPKSVFLKPGESQQLRVVANYRDGSSGDVTRWSMFRVEIPSYVAIDNEAQVLAKKNGESRIEVSFANRMSAARVTVIAPDAEFEWKAPKPTNFVDVLNYRRLRRIQLNPAGPSSDGEFMRRVYLDISGVLPTLEEIDAFLRDKRADKRTRLIDKLLASREFPEWWAILWMHRLGVRERLYIDADGWRLYEWLRRSIAKNTPIDRMVSDLLTAEGSSDKNFAVGFWRYAPTSNVAVERLSKGLLGVRLECARCHRHPAGEWLPTDYQAMATFFSGVGKETEPGVWQVRPTRANASMKFPARLVVGPQATLTKGRNPRKVFADWLTSKRNAQFARSTVNWLWRRLFAHPLRKPVDDMPVADESAHEELLEALAKELVAHEYDLKHVLRLILLSHTYQMSSKPTDVSKREYTHFGHKQHSRLQPEEFVELVHRATEVPESLRTRLRAGPPDPKRDEKIAGRKVSSTILGEMKWVPLSQPARERCRSSQLTPTAPPFLLVNGALTECITSKKNRWHRRLMAAGAEPMDLIDEAFRLMLLREATEKERTLITGHVKKIGDNSKAVEEIIWALANTKEFVFDH